MREVILDGQKMTDRKNLHELFSENLHFPEWYGRNLDALYDCLTDISEDTKITIINWEQARENLGSHAQALQNVLEDAGKANPQLKICISQTIELL
jgi:ribonuclease inhibitor